MRLGAPIRNTASPEEWVKELQKKGYRAAYCPLDEKASDSLIAEYAQAARENDIVIAETGGWSNMLAPDPDTNKRNTDFNIARLILADKIGARCCVNVSGNPKDTAEWDLYFPGFDSDDTYALVAEKVKYILAQADPAHAKYTLEPMQWMIPDSAESYTKLIALVDDDRFGVHFDAVNMINSPSRYAHTGDFIRNFVSAHGKRICSCHAKDVILRREKMLVHLEEILPGRGTLDYDALLTSVSSLDPDTPVMLEHLPDLAAYDEAMTFVRSKAEALGLL